MAQLNHTLGKVESQHHFFRIPTYFHRPVRCIFIILIDRGHPGVKVDVSMLLLSYFSLPRGQHE